MRADVGEETPTARADARRHVGQNVDTREMDEPGNQEQQPFTVEAGDPGSSVLIHVPHSSTRVPGGSDSTSFCLTRALLASWH